MKNTTYAVLLAGGKGTRLWPLSTENSSKSFIKIGKRKPLIEDTINRLRGLITKKNIIIVINEAQKKILKRFTEGIPDKNILIEPFGRSTASAIGLAAIKLKPEDVMIALPTDALVKNVAKFKSVLRNGIRFIQNKKDSLLCIGVKPKEAAVAYGYIKVRPFFKKRDIFSVDKFIEKPEKTQAKGFLKKRNYLWNAGIFIFKAKDILKAMKRCAPLLYKELTRIKMDGRKKRDAYLRMRDISIDYQIMEKAKNLYCIKADFSWSDLGNWVSAGKLLKKDKKGNAYFGRVDLINTYNSIVYNTENYTLSAVGLKNVILVNTENGILTCDKKDAEKVKDLATGLKAH